MVKNKILNSATSLRSILVTCALAGICTAQTTPPDLTAPGIIAALKTDEKASPNYKFTYNLGPTGLRGWIHVDRSLASSGRITDASRHILVTTASAPASSVLAADDVILGAIAAKSGSVPPFKSDARKTFGAVITAAEKTGAGTVRVRRWRNGTTADVNIAIPTIGTYSLTAPYNCPKSSAILASTRNQMVSELLSNPNYLRPRVDHSNAIHALALLASVKEGDPNFSDVQARLQTYARALSNHFPNDDEYQWAPAYMLIFLSEYYLITKDSEVVSNINNLTLWLTRGQSFWGTFGHRMSIPYLDGSGRFVARGYGPVNAVGNACNIAILLGRKALQSASHPIDPKIDIAISRASTFIASHVQKGSLQYGEHSPEPSHYSNGKDATAAVLMGLQKDRAVETEYFSRLSIASWIGTEVGHAGQELGILWYALGAGMGGDLAASGHFKQLLWRFDMHRRTNSTFTYDSRDWDHYDGGTTADGTYLGESNGSGLKGTAIYLLTYSLPLKRLYITGKQADPAYVIDATKVAHAVAAGSYVLKISEVKTPQLFSHIGNYDPYVRHNAAAELASRNLTETDLTKLRMLLSSPDANLRQGAAVTLGRRQDAPALTAIVALLNDTNPIVRHRAAKAILHYSPAAITPHRDAMLASFIANAPANPDVIDPADPLQFMNSQLALVLFGSGLNQGNHIADATILAPKETLLYPALRVGLSLPTGAFRSGVAEFAKNRLKLEDLRALFPEIATMASFDTPSDRMFSGGSRANAISFMAANKIKEGIPIALAMLNVQKNGEFGAGDYLDTAINALASYGADARHTLPTLRGYLETWDKGWTQQRDNLTKAIATIENAPTDKPSGTISITEAAPSIPPGTSSGPVKIFILAGQSNMLGHGEISPDNGKFANAGTLEHIVANDPAGIYQFLKNASGEWVVRDDVFIRDQTPKNGGLTIRYGAWDTTIGPELGFGHVLGDLYDNKILLIKAAWGGKSLVGDFRPPSSGGTIGFYYNEIKRLVKEATDNLPAYVPGYSGQGYEITGFAWHQGWNDRCDEKASAEYQSNMAHFIRDMRSANHGLNAPNMKFVIATTGMAPGADYSTVEKAQLAIANPTTYPDFAGNVAVVDTRIPYKGLPFWYPKDQAPADQDFHWNRSAQSYLHIGLAMGDAMSRLAPGRRPFAPAAVGTPKGINLTWHNGTEAPTSVRILLNGKEIAAAAPATPASFLDATAQPGIHTYEIIFTMPTSPCPPLTTTFNGGITQLKASPAAKGLTLQWTNTMNYPGIQVSRNGTPLGTTLPGNATTFTETPPANSILTYTVAPTTGNSTPVTLKLDTTLTYTHYRFTPKRLRNDSAANSIQLAEFEFALGEKVIDLTTATITNPGGDNPGEQQPPKIADLNPATKWLDFKRQPLIFQFSTPTKIDRYRFSTAEDADERDPVSWKLEGSNDGTTWHLLDQHDSATIPTARQTYTEPFQIIGGILTTP